MNQAGQLVLVLLVAAVASVATSFLLRSDRAETRGEVAPAGDVAARLDELVARQDELARRLDALDGLRAAETTGTREAKGVDLGALAARVAEHLARADDPGGDDKAPIDAKSLADRLFDPLTTDDEREALWEEVRAKGQVDALLAELERRVDEAPFDAVLRTLLGEGYQNKMLTLHGPAAGRFGAKAADAFEKALELDETNFEARFALAQHLYWAQLSGDALEHLGTLVEQQADRVPDPEHAGAYVWHGNLLMDHGRRDEALATWREGLRHFPGDATLRERLDAFQ